MHTGKIEAICKHCSKTFFIHPKKISRSGNFCSKGCWVNWQKKPCLQVCNECGAKFHRPPSRIKRGSGKYCSTACREKHEERDRVHIPDTICQTCGIIFKPNAGNFKKGYGKFCSRECFRKSPGYANRKTRLTIYKFTCVNCGKEFERTGHDRHRNKYCSYECVSAHRIGENHPRWNGGNKIYCEKWTPEFRNRIRAFFGYICVECGTPQNGKLLHCHHVYYNKKACCEISENGEYMSNLGIRNKEPFYKISGDPNKFVALCSSCHAKTSSIKNNNRLYWAEHFEKIVNTYYNGNSYLSHSEQETLNPQTLLPIPSHTQSPA